MQFFVKFNHQYWNYYKFSKKKVSHALNTICRSTPNRHTSCPQIHASCSLKQLKGDKMDQLDWVALYSKKWFGVVQFLVLRGGLQFDYQTVTVFGISTLETPISNNRVIFDTLTIKIELLHAVVSLEEPYCKNV